VAEDDATVGDEFMDESVLRESFLSGKVWAPQRLTKIKNASARSTRECVANPQDQELDKELLYQLAHVGNEKVYSLLLYFYLFCFIMLFW
jgi:hypothetical protein